MRESLGFLFGVIVKFGLLPLDFIGLHLVQELRCCRLRW